MLRKAAVAGTFYPANPGELLHFLEEIPRPESPRDAVAVVVPHAGYLYSGSLAGRTFAAVRLPRRFIVLCPNHTGVGAPVSAMSQGQWETPLGRVEIDSDLASRLRGHSLLVQDNALAHRNEHAVEVQLPFLQHFVEQPIRFVPLSVGTCRYESLIELGKSLARAVRESGERVMLVASTDMNHFESARRTEEKDRLALEKIEKLDTRGLYDVIHSHNISMCGYGPTIAVMEAARALGASSARLVGHTHSGDINGETSSVVGYAGLLIH